MNRKQQNILFVCAALIALMPLFPPFYGSREYYEGYRFLLMGDISDVNTKMLFTQWVAVLLVGGLLWFAMKDKENK